jgi:phosphatidylinositol alpha-mannosyltransferase
VRIAQVCSYSLTAHGGVRTQVLGLARALRELGHETRVLAPCDGPPPDAGVTPLGRSIPVPANGSVAPIAPDIACALRTIRALRDEDFDVVHVHEPFAPGPSLTSLLVAEPPVIGTFHRDRASMGYRLAKPVLGRMARRLAARCVVSADARRTAEEAVGRGDYELLFNGIEVERFSKAAVLPTSGPTIMFMGRHEPRKGLAVLLAALRHLPADVVLWVGGSGPQTEQLRAEYAADARIEWLGRIGDEEKAERLRSADIFCAPSTGGESFGVVLLEAMAASTSIVASDLPGYRNVARPDEHAVLVAPDDPAALAQALRRVLDDAPLAARLSAAADERAAEFSMDTLANAYVEIYHRITA